MIRGRDFVYFAIISVLEIWLALYVEGGNKSNNIPVD